jgi:hypothetical protein
MNDEVRQAIQVLHRLSPWALDERLSELERRITRMEIRMGKQKDSLAKLDAELDSLAEYIRSDDETDSAEVDSRTERIRQMLAAAQGSGQADDTKVADVESQLSDLGTEASEQTATDNSGSVAAGPDYPSDAVTTDGASDTSEADGAPEQFTGGPVTE